MNSFRICKTLPIELILQVFRKETKIYIFGIMKMINYYFMVYLLPTEILVVLCSQKSGFVFENSCNPWIRL